jgi:hypothetical protein
MGKEQNHIHLENSTQKTKDWATRSHWRLTHALRKCKEFLLYQCHGGCHRCRDGRLVIYLDTCHFWCEYKAKIKWINQKWIQRGCCTQSLSTICIIYGDYLAKFWWFNLLYRTKNTRLDQKIYSLYFCFILTPKMARVKIYHQPSVPTPMCLLWYNFTKFLHNFNIDDNTILCFIRFYIFKSLTNFIT